MKLTNSQNNLYRRQKEDPIFMYYNPQKGWCFGLVRLGSVDVHITNSLRPLKSDGYLITGASYKHGDYSGFICDFTALGNYTVEEDN